MEMEIANELAASVERLATAAGLLEQAAERLMTSNTDLAASAQATVQSTLDRIVATADASRESELFAKLTAAEQRIAELEARAVGLEARAAAPESTTGRRTLPASTANLFAKHGVATESIQAGAIDAALVHLSMEQRIAVKAELMRAGVIG